MKKWLSITILFIIIIVEITVFSCFKHKSAELTPTIYLNIFNNQINDTAINIIKKNLNLMVVAHPDDETLWGGGSLIEKDYYVICVTCGNVPHRDKEFKKIMELTNDDFEFLGYPDIDKNGVINRWLDEKPRIEHDLKNIIDSYNWETIVTHNPDGEYGHIQHKMVNQIVTRIADKNKLYYFGKYYPNEVPTSKTLSEETYNKKINELISVYKSQPKAIKRHHHMLKYENFLQYSEW